MQIKYGVSALALLATFLVYPQAARADLTKDQKAQIIAAVDAAMLSGNTAPLQALLTTIVTADPTNNAVDAATIAAQEIDKDQAANPGQTISGSTTTIADAVTTAMMTSIVSAAPAQAGLVLSAAQATLAPDLLVAAVTATQTALAPAAGGPPQNNPNGNNNNNNNNPATSPISQTAEVPRQITASPSS